MVGEAVDTVAAVGMVVDFICVVGDFVRCHDAVMMTSKDGREINDA